MEVHTELKQDTELERELEIKLALGWGGWAGGAWSGWTHTFETGWDL